MPRSLLGVDGLPGPDGLAYPLPPSDFRPTDGVKLDFDLCIMLTGLLGWPLPPKDRRLPVDVAAFNLCTVGFSGTGRGIFDSHGKSGEGGACTLGDGLGLLGIGPATMPSATFCISLLHLSHNFNFAVGCSVSGVVKGLP